MRSWSAAGSAARPGDQQPCAADRRGQRRIALESAASRWYIVGTPNSIVARPASAVGRGLGGEAAEVPRRAAAAQRPEHAQDQPVDVEQRQPVRDDVLTGPRPRVGERVEVGGDRPPRQHDALRRPGRARRVDDDRRRLVVRRVRGHAPDAERSTSSSVRSGAESDRMCSSSRSPDFGLIGTIGTPAASAPTTATTRLQRRFGDHRDARRTRRPARPPRPRPRAAARRSARPRPPGSPRGRPAPPNLSRARTKFYPVQVL